jgi:hypothetical protein
LCSMDLVELQKRLVAAARANPPSDAVPYAFAKRIMARIGSLRREDPIELWGRALWRAAAPCLVIMLLLGAWVWLSPGVRSSQGDLSQEFDNAVLAGTVSFPSPDATR